MIDDNLFEVTEDFTVHISTDDPFVVVTTANATVTITDNEGAFSFTPSNSTSIFLLVCITAFAR